MPAIDIQDFLEQVKSQSDGNLFSTTAERVFSALLTYNIQQTKEIFDAIDTKLGIINSSLQDVSFPELKEIRDVLKQLVNKEPEDRTDEILKALKALSEDNKKKLVEHKKNTEDFAVAVENSIKPLLLQNERIIMLLEKNLDKEQSITIQSPELDGANSVTGLGKTPYRNFRSRYRKVNIKPQEAVDGARTQFTLPHIPVRGTEEVKADGVSIFSDNGDYTLVGQKITFTNAPQNSVRINYDV